jgi:hypothetical protein
VALIIKSYSMYDQIPASLYRRIVFETDGKKYRLRILEGEVIDSQPYVHIERKRHSRLYSGKKEAGEAAEMLLRKFESVGWHVCSSALPAPRSIRQNRRHAKGPAPDRNCARGHPDAITAYPSGILQGRFSLAYCSGDRRK